MKLKALKAVVPCPADTNCRLASAGAVRAIPSEIATKSFNARSLGCCCLAFLSDLVLPLQNPPTIPKASTLNASRLVKYGLIPASKALASVVVPIFDVDGTPTVLIVLTSGEKWFSFVCSLPLFFLFFLSCSLLIRSSLSLPPSEQEPTDRRFASSVGAIIVGSLLCQRALTAYRAKLAFVRSASVSLSLCVSDSRFSAAGLASLAQIVCPARNPQTLPPISTFLQRSMY